MKAYRAPIEEQYQKMKDNAAKLNEKMEEIPETKEEEEEKQKSEEDTSKIEKNTENSNNIEQIEKIVDNSKRIEGKIEKKEENFVEFYKNLLCLKDSQIKIIPIFEDIDKIIEKKKFMNFFDVAVFGFIHSGYIKKPELLNIMKEKSEILIESSRYLVPLKIKEREDLDLKLIELAKNLKLEEKSMSKPYYKCFSKG